MSKELFIHYFYPILLCFITFFLNYFLNWKFKKKDKLPMLHVRTYISRKKDMLKNKRIYKFKIKTVLDISSEEENLNKYKYFLDFERIFIDDIKENMYGFYFKELDKVAFLFSHIEYIKYGKFEVDSSIIELSNVLYDEDIFVCSKDEIPEYFYCNINYNSYRYEIIGENENIFCPKRYKNK